MSVSHVWYVVQLSIAVQLATQRFVVQTIMYCCLSWSCGLLGSAGMSSLESLWSFQEAGKGAICRWYTGLDVQDDCFGTRLSPQQDAGAGTRGGFWALCHACRVLGGHRIQAGAAWCPWCLRTKCHGLGDPHQSPNMKLGTEGEGQAVTFSGRKTDLDRE